MSKQPRGKRLTIVLALVMTTLFNAMGSSQPA